MLPGFSESVTIRRTITSGRDEYGRPTTTVTETPAMANTMVRNSATETGGESKVEATCRIYGAKDDAQIGRHDEVVASDGTIWQVLATPLYTRHVLSPALAYWLVKLGRVD